jgi:hypothetical protein
MRAVETLRRDHEFFRWCLRELKTALEQTDARERLLLLGNVLAKRLQHHSRREGRLVVLCGQRLGRYGIAELVRFSIDHDIDRAFLQVMRRGVADPHRFSPEHVRLAVQALVAECHAHADEQEAQLFPLLEDVMSRRPSVARRRLQLARPVPVPASAYPHP